MSQLKDRPSNLLDAAPRRSTRYTLLDGTDPREERRTLGVGLVLTIGGWLLCFFFFDLLISQLDHQHTTNNAGVAKRAKPIFDIQLQPDEYLMPKVPPPLPDRFVETNPDAPENTPDNTRNFAAQNQQAAQEIPTPDGKSDRAATEGKKDWDSSQVVSGRLAPPQLPSPPEPPPVPAVQETTALTDPTPAQREVNPLSGDQKIQGDSATGFGLNNLKVPDNAKNVSPDANEIVKGVTDGPDNTGQPQITQPRIDPKHPQPRLRVAKNVRPAVLADNKFGTQNVGITGIDAKWSNYGQYLQKLIDTVQIQWDDLNEKSRVSPPTGTKITVRFRLEATKGAISEIIESDGNGGTQATRICVSAITERSPFGKWTDDMVAMLGDSQEMTFTFYYGNP